MFLLLLNVAQSSVLLSNLGTEVQTKACIHLCLTWRTMLCAFEMEMRQLLLVATDGVCERWTYRRSLCVSSCTSTNGPTSSTKKRVIWHWFCHWMHLNATTELFHFWNSEQFKWDSFIHFNCVSVHSSWVFLFRENKRPNIHSSIRMDCSSISKDSAWHDISLI